MTSTERIAAKIADIKVRANRAAPSWYSGDGLACMDIVRREIPALLAALEKAIEQRNDALSPTGLIHFDGKESADAEIANLLDGKSK